MQNACLWLRLLFFKNFILREDDNNSLSLQVATTQQYSLSAELFHINIM